MSSNPLTKVDTYCWLALPEAGYWVAAQGCVCRLGGHLNNGLAAQMRTRGVLYMLRAIQIDVFAFTFRGHRLFGWLGIFSIFVFFYLLWRPLLYTWHPHSTLIRYLGLSWSMIVLDTFWLRATVFELRAPKSWNQVLDLENFRSILRLTLGVWLSVASTPYSSSEPNESVIVIGNVGGDKFKYVSKLLHRGDMSRDIAHAQWHLALVRQFVSEYLDNGWRYALGHMEHL